MSDPLVAVLVWGGILTWSAIYQYRWYFGNPNGPVLRKMEQSPRRSIAEVSEGDRVRIVGTVETSDPPFASGFAGRNCIAYQVVFAVEGLMRASWETDQRIATLVVRDATGRTEIVSRDAELALTLDFRTSFGAFTSSPPELEALLARHGASRQKFALFEKKRVTVREGIVNAGDEIAVVGTARWEIDADGTGGGYRDAPKRLVLEKCVVSNDPRARR